MRASALQYVNLEPGSALIRGPPGHMYKHGTRLMVMNVEPVLESGRGGRL